MLAPTLVPPLARVLGWPAARFGGAAGSSRAATRSAIPSRTASTASALMIGARARHARRGPRRRAEDDVRGLGEHALHRRLRAHVARTASRRPRSPPERRCAQLPGRHGRQRRARRRRPRLRPPRSASPASGRRQQGDRREMDRRQPATPAQLGANGAFVAKDYAKEHHLTVGSPIELETPTGATLHLTLKGIFDPPKGGSPFGDVTISTATLRPRLPEPAEPVRVPEDERRRHRREHAAARGRAAVVPGREDPDESRSSRRTRSAASTCC